MVRLVGAGAVCLAALFIGPSGCSRVDVRVDSFLSEKLVFPEPGSGTIGVFVEAHPRSELFEEEIATLLRRMLEEGGYVVAGDDAQRPDHVLACWVSVDGGTTHTGTDAYREPSWYYTTRSYSSDGRRVISRTYVPGSVHYLPYSYTVFRRRLALFLYQGGVPTTTQEARAGGKLVWQANAVSTGGKPDLRRTIPYLLVAAFKYWKQDSGHEQRESFRRGDDRVERLRSAREEG